MKPDIILSVTCPKIIGREILEIPPAGCINVHCSILPKGRGRDPAFWSLYQGHKRTAVTIHYMDEEMDRGTRKIEAPSRVARRSLPPTEKMSSFFKGILKEDGNIST